MRTKFFGLLVFVVLGLNILGLSCHDPLEGVEIEEVGDQQGIFAKDYKSKKSDSQLKRNTEDNNKNESSTNSDNKPKPGDTTEAEDEEIFDMDF